MTQTVLISRLEIQNYVQLSSHTNNEVLNGLILQAQIQDIAPLLGEKLFNDLLTSPNNYSALLNGGNYIYDTVSYLNYGLKAVLANYVYARNVMFGGVIDTPFGVVEKLNASESQPISYKTKEALYQLNRDTAFTLWKSVENFLIRTNEPFFNELSLCQKEITSNFKIRKIQ